MTEEWITCPQCKAEGEVGMEWIDGEHFVPGSGTTCPLCEGAMCFEDEIALESARAALNAACPQPSQGPDQPKEETVHLPKLLAVEFGISTSEGRRLIHQGGVSIDGEKTTAADLDVDRSRIDRAEVKLGKRREKRIELDQPKGCGGSGEDCKGTGLLPHAMTNPGGNPFGPPRKCFGCSHPDCPVGEKPQLDHFGELDAIQVAAANVPAFEEVEASLGIADWSMLIAELRANGFELAGQEQGGLEGHRVELTFDGFGPGVKLLHPEGGCPLPEGVCEECGADLQNPESKRCKSCDEMVPGWCWVQDWVENDGHELLHGKVTLPVEAEWDGDSARLHVQQPASSQPVPAHETPEARILDALHGAGILNAEEVEADAGEIIEAIGEFSSQPVLDVEGPEVVASVEGVVAFLRSERDEESPADACICCDGPHIFARGIDIEDEPRLGRERPHFSDYISRALSDNSLEGRRVRVSLEVLPAALSDRSFAGSISSTQRPQRAA